MTVTQSVHEPSAWMRRAIARRLAQLERLGPWDGVAIAPLGKPTGHGRREDRTCDRCRTYVPHGIFYPGSIRPRPDVVLIVGLCQRCAQLEMPTEDLAS